ncbi:MAG: DnaJ domain-containing protein [Nitrospira sp.]|nr:DnaJ domain-containing protein [Nitrospira sp.]
MNNILKYIWPVLLGIYILSPLDAHPLFIDDLIAGIVLFYYLRKNSREARSQTSRNYNSGDTSSGKSGWNPNSQPNDLTLEKAYILLGVSSKADMDEISSAFREKVSKSHPDKVTHLSEELQERARELTMNFNMAYDLIKKQKKK